MFSLIKNGIKNINPDKTIDFNELINLIKDNPQKALIEEIRLLKLQQNPEYRKLKQKLTYITPNCIVNKRKLTDNVFQTNFIDFSGYVYFDIDVNTNAVEFKRYFVERYGHQVSLVSISCSCGGISILVRIDSSIKTKEEFQFVWDEIRTTIFPNEKVDLKVRDMGRSMFISYDPDVYVNESAVINVDYKKMTIDTDKKCLKQGITRSNINNTLIYAISELPSINDVLQKLVLQTNVEVEEPVLMIAPLDFTKVRFARKIPDGKKHQIYRAIIHGLIHLNPGIDYSYFFSYLHFINERFAIPKMQFKELQNLFKHAVQQTQAKGYVFNGLRIKKVHLNKKCKIQKPEKVSIINRVNGKIRSNQSISRIIEAKELIISRGEKVTKSEVQKITGLSRWTVIKWFDAEEHDLNEIVKGYNSPAFTTRLATVDSGEAAIDDEYAKLSNDQVQPAV